ncbi:FimV/HubP family polar landmark protein [Aeromonas schubertii]|uniref:FimV/HubP family polar landmark protein n=1 Tax=Aeromonas schubertii TaxID=652 RepID=UPI00067E67D7|nr:FimV/HubP family polar landmark protein [Aeromonas schubertii]KUE81449.1 hypothetical protein ATO46_00445 [Aeromonas schubertii]MBZ6073623.1 pilus assembly protein FimV [Aeromonas schubertii]
MGHSRIALATLLVLGLLTPVHAEQREPFFVELKGPDEPVQPSQPTQATPAVPQRTQAPAPAPRQPVAASTSVGRYGPILRTDTLWSLANRYRPSTRVSVYQTMVAIYEKNPRSFADGNINHILVGSTIVLPNEQEASRISDEQARARFRSDNASWKGISSRYTAEVKNLTVHPKPAVKSAGESKPKVESQPQTTTKPAKPEAVPQPEVVAKVEEKRPAPLPKPVEPAPATKVEEAPQVKAEAEAPKPLPPETQTEQPSSVTEMKLALDDATSQLSQVSETNHRLKLRVESLTQELETLKAQLQDQESLQKQIAELKAGMPAPAAPDDGSAKPDEKNWLLDLLSSPLNLAMIILLPVLLVLALVTLWLRARARRELEEQEKSLSESTSAFMEEGSNEFDELLSPELGALDLATEPQAAPEPEPIPEPEPEYQLEETKEEELFFHDEHDLDEPAHGPVDPDLVPEPADSPESLMADADLLPGDDDAHEVDQQSYEEFDLSELDAELDKMLADSDDSKVSLSSVDEALELTLDESLVGDSEPREEDPNELALADFEDAFKQAEQAEPAAVPDREAADDNHYVEIDTLLAEADAAGQGEEPYQNATLDVGLDGFPEVLPERSDFDIDADDGGVGAKLDLARAYLEIDDKDSARELLEEAAAQGSDSQRKEAEKLLKRLG